MLTYPLMVGIQMVSARMGRVTGHGLASNIRAAFPAAGALRDRRDARRRQHDQRRRRHRGDGRGAAARRRRPGARSRDRVRGRFAAAAGVPALPALRRLSQVADALAARVRGGRLHHRDPVARGARRPRLAARCADRADADRHRRRVRDHDQSVPVLLAGGAGGRGDQRGSGGIRARASARGGARAPPSDQDRHLRRDGVLEPHRAVHHHQHGRDAARGGRHRHPDVGAGRGSTASAGGGLGVPAVQPRHHRHRTARRAGARGLRGLRGGRDVRMDERPRPEAPRGARVLRDHRARDVGRRRARLHADRSDQGAVLERRDQRRDRRPDHGRDDAARRRPEGDGSVHRHDGG